MPSTLVHGESLPITPNDVVNHRFHIHLLRIPDVGDLVDVGRDSLPADAHSSAIDQVAWFSRIERQVVWVRISTDSYRRWHKTSHPTADLQR